MHSENLKLKISPFE